jgi:hypothetical protein
MPTKNEGLKVKQGAIGLCPGNIDMLVVQTNGVIRRTRIAKKTKSKKQ